jgi:hypothetical protein
MSAMTARPDRTGGGVAGTIASEWTKLWSVRSTWWCLAGAATLMVLFAAAMSYPPEQTAGIPRSRLLLLVH